MQPLLVIRQCWQTAAIAAAGHVGDTPLFFLDYLLRIIRVAVLLSIWRIILDGKGDVAGLTLGTVLTYTLVAELFSDLLACRTELPWAMFVGSIGARFLWPMGLVAQFGAEAAGRWAFGLAVFSLPLFLIAPLLGVNQMPASAAHAGLFVLSLALAIAVGLALEFIFTGLAANLEQNVYAVDRVRGGINALLSGAILPLALYPWGLGTVFGLLPFASMASAPLQIYTGTGDAAQLLAIQAFWAVVLWPIAQWVWRVNRQKLVTYGG
jgi:ABC-2 type transport system permease protein